MAGVCVAQACPLYSVTQSESRQLWVLPLGKCNMTGPAASFAKLLHLHTHRTGAYVGHTQHIEIETTKYLDMLLRGPVIHDHNEQNSGAPCLFHLSNPIVVKLKLHKQEDIQLFNKFNYVVKKPKWVFQSRHFVETLNLFVRPRMQEFQQLLFLFHVGHNNITVYAVSIVSWPSL